MLLKEVVMRFLRPMPIKAAFLIIAVSVPQSFFSQTAPKPSQQKPPAPRQRPTNRPQSAGALAKAINELLKHDPLKPESPGAESSDGGAENAGDSSEKEIKPPADDAPIKELIVYWSKRNSAVVNEGEKGPEPSEIVRRRLLEAVEDRPWLASSLFIFLPKTPDAYDRLYRMINQEPEDEREWKLNVRDWLSFNSNYFRDELLADIDSDNRSNGWAKIALTLLSGLDWEAVRPMLERNAAENNEIPAPVSLSLLYARELQVGSAAKAEEYRAILKAMVANRRLWADSRGTAIITLMSTKWNGREEWFVSLFSDPSLSGLPEDAENGPDGKNAMGANAVTEYYEAFDINEPYYRSPSNLFSAAIKDQEELIPTVSPLIGHANRTVHKAAVKCLVDVITKTNAGRKAKQDAARSLLPLLTDPNWADVNDRAQFIGGLADLELPESVAGLIWILDYDESDYYRALAADALTRYRDPRAIPGLRRALDRETNEARRAQIVTALAECGGFSDDELVAAAEAYARVVVTEKGSQEIGDAMSGESDKPLPLRLSVGRILHESNRIQINEGLAARLFERAKALRAAQPAAARKILRMIEGAPLRVAELNMVERIGEGWVDVDSITLALTIRERLRRGAGNELYSLVKQGGYAAGVAAVILNDARELKSLLEGRDAEAQQSLLAGARYLRDKLPVELVGKLYDSPNRALSLAAESYLEVEDSAEARKLILARRPGEAYVVGEITAVWGGDYVALDWEEKLRKEIKGHNGLDAIYALARMDAEDFGRGAIVIRVRQGMAEMSVFEHNIGGRRNVRWLTESEFEELRSFTSRQEVEDLGPESYTHNPLFIRTSYEYLRMTKDGGRRIMLDDLWRAPKDPTLHEELSGLFHRLSNTGEFVVKYAIEDKIPGVEVLLADKTQSAEMVCGAGGEIRVLIGEKETGYKPNSAAAAPEWREFSSGGPGGVTDDPPACRTASSISMVIKNEWNDRHSPHGQMTQSGDAWVYSSLGTDAGVWKYAPGTEPAKVLSGFYQHPLITPDGKWLVALKRIMDEERMSWQLVRHNLKTGEEFPIIAPYSDYRPPCAFVAAHGKVLLCQRRSFDHDVGAFNYLLDPETGIVQPVRGEFALLADGAARELQPTGKPNEFWAVIYSQQQRGSSFGRYDSKNFSFTPVVELPDLRLTSNDVWVDAVAGKIWITYQGQLLRLPLPTQPQ
jgi:HEAT repeat protein